MDRQILFSAGECVLGTVLVARSERGVCAILLGDDARELERDLRARFPHDDLHESTTELAPLLANVRIFLKTPRTGLDVPLDLRGTDLEQRVWQALREIPPGTTETYSDHRVLRKGGSLGGYRWGLRRKRTLLERERAA